MPYPGQFHRLVVIGNLYTDKFNFSLSIVPNALGELGMPAVGAPTLASVAAAVSAWWAHTTFSSGAGAIQYAQLTSIKLNRIGTDGRYVDPVAMEHVYTTPVPGPLSQGYVPQVAIAVSLRTAIERGRGSKGRFYLPPTHAVGTYFTSSDGRISAAGASQQASGAKALITSLNSIYTAIGKVGVASDAGSGRFEHVTKVAVGRVPDTMRSRRSTQVEDHQEVTI